MRVLPVGEIHHLLEGADHQRRKVGRLLLEPARDRRVVAGGVRERFGGQALPRPGREPAIRLPELIQHRVIGLGAHDRRNVGEVLGRRADHRRAADVDVLDRVGIVDLPPPDRPLERVQVHAHEVDHLDVVLVGRLHMGRLVTHRQQSGVKLWMKRLDAAVHDLRKAGQVRDLAYLQPGRGQLTRRPPGRDELDPELPSPRANSTSPVLSETDSRARATLTSGSVFAPPCAADSVPCSIRRDSTARPRRAADSPDRASRARRQSAAPPRAGARARSAAVAP